MIIGKKLQTEIIDELLHERDEIIKRQRAETSRNIIFLLEGELLGIDYCRQLILSWNEPNHGKVSPQTN